MSRTARASAPVPLPPLGRAQWTGLWLLASVVAALGVSYRLYDADLWQHLCAGREMWTARALPMTNTWTWPTYGAPMVLPSWLFRVLLWPFWAAGQEAGLLLWRVLTLAGAFAIAAFTARRMGARGVALVVAILWSALLFRLRSMVRPETLAAVLLAAHVWILETRRRGGPDRSAWIVPIAWVWINVHISWYLAPLLTGFHVLAEALGAARRRSGARPPRGLALVLLASLAVVWANPFGAAAVLQPFQFAFDLRHHPLYAMVLELQPITWAAHVRDGLPPWMALVAVSLALRTLRGRGDFAGTLTSLWFLGTALMSQRLVGFMVVALAPTVARDLTEALAALPATWTPRGTWARAALAALFMAAGAAPQLLQDPWRPGWGFDWRAYPVRACDWVAAHHVGGREFGAFHASGYLVWRFHPDRDRLPFMDGTMAATREDEDLYAACWTRPDAWRALDAKYRFDWLLMPLPQFAGQDLVDRLDADSTWALVFLDDAAAVYLRRDGRDSTLARTQAYAILPAGDRALVERVEPAQRDSLPRVALRAELERMLRESEFTWRAHSTLATLDLLDHRWDEAESELERTRALNPSAPMLAEREAALRQARYSGAR